MRARESKRKGQGKGLTQWGARFVRGSLAPRASPAPGRVSYAPPAVEACGRCAISRCCSAGPLDTRTRTHVTFFLLLPCVFIMSFCLCFFRCARLAPHHRASQAVSREGIKLILIGCNRTPGAGSAGPGLGWAGALGPRGVAFHPTPPPAARWQPVQGVARARTHTDASTKKSYTWKTGFPSLIFDLFV